MGERKGKVKSRNMYKRPMDKDNGGEEDGMWGEQGRGIGEKWGQL